MAKDHAEPDVLVHLKAQPAFPQQEGSSPHEVLYTSPYSGTDEQPSLRVTRLGACFVFSYCDGARYAIDYRGRELWADWPDGYAVEDAATYLVGPVLGFVLRLRGMTPLHASVVALENQAFSFVGSPGAGKSTTAAAFAHLGFDVLSDDIAAVEESDGRFMVAPGYPRVNLWPDSVRNLLGSPDALPLITPTWGKRYLSLGQDGPRFRSKHLPLAGVYLLAPRDPHRTLPLFEDVAQGDALMSLVANTYVNYVLDRDMRHREFDLLSRLVAQVPVRRIHPSDDPSALLGMCEAIARDARQTMDSSFAGATRGAD